ncbi:MAG: AAA family ATPase [Candidatus Omnitrophota bacterium]
MYLKKLDVFGFKSFADKTVLNFGPGITAIVGPNGCGKSNVFDAIRWVLGEQSVKELRGSSMEDVIFNGTDKKPPLGFAEVSLTFSNESRMLPVEYNEVTVTRRLYRSGESEYLMNKTPVRLKDITEMFMGTGIGAEAYSMIQQGRVDLVVSAKPEERRVILDEAAGVTKYKSKRREALSKLSDTENNLLRINDIVIEVKRQIASCERQAKKAQRYREEFDKLKVLEIKYARHQLSVFNQNKEQIRLGLEEMKEKELKLQQELEEFTNLIDLQTGLLEELEEKINQVHADEIKLDSQIDINDRQIGFNEERIGNIDQSETRINATIQQLEERCRQQREKIDEINKYLSTLDEEVQRDLGCLQEKKERLQQIGKDVNLAKAEILEKEESVLRITASQVGIKNKLTESMKQVQNYLARQRRLEHEQQKILIEKGQIDTKFTTLVENIDRVCGLVNDLRSDIQRRREILSSRDKEFHALEDNIEDLERKQISLRSQKEFIEKLSAQYDDIPDPVVRGRLITNAPPLEHHTGIVGKVCEVRPVSNEDDIQQLAESLGSRQLYEIICETKFIELDPVQISARIEELSSRLVIQIQDKESVSLQMDELRQGIQTLELQFQEREKELSILQAQKDDVLQEVNKLNDELELVKVEMEEVSSSLEAYHQAEHSLTHQLEMLNQELNEAQTTIKERQDLIQVKALEREEFTVAIAQLEAEVHSVEDKRTSHTENLKIFKETLETSLSEVLRLQQEQMELQGKKIKYHEDIEHTKEAILRLKEERQSLEGVLSGYRSEKEELIQRVNSLKANVAGYTDDIEKIHRTVHAQQMSEQEIGFKEKEIKDRLFQAYKIDFNQMADEQGLDESILAGEVSGDGPLSIEEMQVIIERLRRRCESFGTVNLVAIEEFEELRGRFEFLTQQQSDLLTAKESLHETIRKINRETRQMFLNTFTRVSEEFRIYFRMLFGGGEAQLVLLDPENVLESGVDIIARPPGKKRQNISLLSGGEKTLTAIALVFGVFKINPSPFCVLDEIDAALDESNVGRYSYLLKDFAKIAQFIVITHNKRTIESANVLYGITMQETGVSKVVSVKFGEKGAEIDEDEKIAVPVTAE